MTIGGIFAVTTAAVSVSKIIAGSFVSAMISASSGQKSTPFENMSCRKGLNVGIVLGALLLMVQYSFLAYAFFRLFLNVSSFS